MPLLEELLTPIDGPSRGGQPIRNTQIYDDIKKAREQDDGLSLGVWESERKVADFPLVIKLSKEAFTKSKDLYVAAWFTEALLKTEGFGGLHLGLSLCLSLIQQFWDSLYPLVDDGDLEPRAAPLNWVGSKLEVPLKSAKLADAGYGWYQFNESRIIGYETAATTDADKKKRTAALKEGKISAEDFDKAFVETPKTFYVKAERDLDSCLAVVNLLNETCNEKFVGSDESPSFDTLEKSLQEVRHSVHQLLEKKRETEPDPPEPQTEPIPEPKDSEVHRPNISGLSEPPKEFQGLVIPLAASEPPATRDAIAGIARHAAFLRERDPYSPAPYLLMRGLRWGELRAAAAVDPPDASRLEAPPMELRRHIKSLAMAGKWEELLNAAETTMSLSCSRAWLDLQRFVVQSCVELGPAYHNIAKAIQSELRSLLRDIPQLLSATLMDDTPAANPETQNWLLELLQSEQSNPDGQNVSTPAPNLAARTDKIWNRKLVDSYTLATDALRAGSPSKALEILIQDIEAQRSGRTRFQRKIQVVELCVSFGRPEIAQPMLEDLAVAIENHKLETWEDPALVSKALVLIMKLNKKVADSAAERAKMFDRICRLHPLRALEL